LGVLASEARAWARRSQRNGSAQQRELLHRDDRHVIGASRWRYRTPRCEPAYGAGPGSSARMTEGFHERCAIDCSQRLLTTAPSAGTYQVRLPISLTADVGAAGRTQSKKPVRGTVQSQATASRERTAVLCQSSSAGDCAPSPIVFPLRWRCRVDPPTSPASPFIWLVSAIPLSQSVRPMIIGGFSGHLLQNL
jgi:hypothetical protein